MTSLDFNNISPRDKAVLMGIFLSKFDRKALDVFGFDGFWQAFNTLGYSIGIPPRSVKNYRDEFDPYFPNPRKGWRNRELRDYCRLLMEETESLSFEDFYGIIRSFVSNEVVDSFSTSSSNSNKSKREFLANRLITGKAAEQYFIMNYQSIDMFQGCTLIDTTNQGCGYDFRLTWPSSHFFVEVKGINDSSGNILMTEKEHRVAEAMKDLYCLFVVRNFKSIPEHQLYFDPLRSNALQFQRHEREVIQVSYSAKFL